ncbi:hypothetical protein ACFV6F_38945, partial [Kitasatospora phosalacinea]|uniref:hypothetical protein n=1 Tax=Kitasatospora phosalacinea TaxID=2065 RepID=UPI00365EC1EC
FQGFPAGSSVTVPVTFTLDPTAPNQPSMGRAVFTIDADNTQDGDSDLSRNIGLFTFIRESFGAPVPGNVNLHFTITPIPLVINGAPQSIPLHFYNSAGNLLHGTRSTSRFTFSTPFYTRLPAAGRPSGLSTLYENDDPAIPSIYRLTVPPGVGALGGSTPLTIPMPFQSQPGATPFMSITTGLYLPSGDDHQGDTSITHHHLGLLHVLGNAV